MKILKKIIVENSYSGSNWNYEKTTKYIIQVNDIKVEAGYFEHYKDDQLIKVVLELPQSYGCPSKCRFCASAGIEKIQFLDADVLEEIFCNLYIENKLHNQQYVLLTMTGMGDIFFNYDNVEKFLLRLNKYSNLYVTLSSCLWNAELIQKIKKISNSIKIRNIQITFVSDQDNILSWIIPYYQNYNYDFRELIRCIEQGDEDYYRINYIMIKGINDSKEVFCRVCNKLKVIGDKIIVRISRLNETGATRKNNLQPTDIATMEVLQRMLTEKKIKSYIFYAEKNDNMNCGQLITESEHKG